MTHVDLAQAQAYLRQQANRPARKLRRQLTGAALLLVMAGGYGLYHASAKPAPQSAGRITAIPFQDGQNIGAGAPDNDRPANIARGHGER